MGSIKHIFITLSCACLIVGCGGGPSSGSSDTSNSISTPTPVSVYGGGVKGPLAQADVGVFQVDFNAEDLRGNNLAIGSTDDRAQITDLSIDSDVRGMLLVEFTSHAATVDITTDDSPLYDRLITVVDANRILDGDAIYATPLTTMTVMLAQQNADSGEPFSGNGDSTVTEAEFLAALDVAQARVKSTLGGLSANVDIFVVPPVITSDTDTTEEQTDTAAYRQANEMLAAMTQYVADTSSAEDNAQAIFEGLVEDLSDGEIDGTSNGEEVALFTALDTPIAQIISGVDPDALLIPGTQTPITDIESVLVNETEITEMQTDTSALEDGAISVDPSSPVLVADSDQDGVVDSLDAFPLDPEETMDTDADGVGDNGDVFPQDPSESSDADGDQVGDNSDAFPLDPSESADADGDGMGDNGDAFPNDPTEVADSDGDQVGDNADAFPNDPQESVDSDGDGTGDNGDAFPNDPTESADTDNDGVGNNADAYPEDPERSEVDSVLVGMWIGENDTLVSFPENPNGVEHYRSRQVDCNFTNYSLCDNGELDPVVGSVITDSATQISQNSYHQFVANGRSGDLDVGIDRWVKRDNHATLTFNNRMWIIGGNDAIYEEPFDGSLANDVWSSQDGDTWVQVTDDAGFSVRSYHTVIEFQGKMWLIGGSTYNQQTQFNDFLNDVWSSEDGKNWTQVTDSAPFSPRRSPGLVVYDDKLWLMGGTGTDFNGLNDVWYTENGSDWVQATADADFQGLTYVLVIDFNNQMMIIGGPGIDDRVWASTNGVDWTLQENTNFPARNVYAVAVYDDKIWVVGGYSNGGYLSDVWVSEDGLTYTEVPKVDGHFFFQRANPGLLSFNDRLWILGGRRASNFNDILSSTDGATWVRHSFGPEGLPQHYAGELLGFNDELFSFAGATYDLSTSIWSSGDGLSWRQRAGEAAYSGLYSSESFVFDDRMWLVGGMVRDGVNPTAATNSVWSSEDGVNWVEEISEAAFSPRMEHKIVEWNGRFWMVAGTTYRLDEEVNDVWSSADGVNWTLETDNAGFTARYSHGLVAFNDKLWVIGGMGSTFARFEDVWSSTNGVDWVPEDISAGTMFRPRDTGARINFETIVFNNKILLIGGQDSAGELSDIWSSTDGVTWIQETADSGIPARTGFALTIFEDQLWLHGGSWTDGLAFYQKDVWKSDDGVNWRVGLLKDVSLRP